MSFKIGEVVVYNGMKAIYIGTRKNFRPPNFLLLKYLEGNEGWYSCTIEDEFYNRLVCLGLSKRNLWFAQENQVKSLKKKGE